MSSRKLMAVSATFSCLLALSAQAATSSSSSTAGSGIDAALTACSASVAKDSYGGPDQTAMTTCMTAKGFTKPSGGSGNGQGGPGGSSQSSSTTGSPPSGGGTMGPPPGGGGSDSGRH